MTPETARRGPAEKCEKHGSIDRGVLVSGDREYSWNTFTVTFRHIKFAINGTRKIHVRH